MELSEEMRLPTVKVRRDGGRGWHLINLADFDPARHQVVDDDPAPAAESISKPTYRKRRG